MALRSKEKELIERADLTIQNLLDDGGLLPPEMAEQFYRKVMLQQTIFNDVRQVPMTRNELKVPTIVSSGRMLQAARNMYSSGSTGDDQGYGTPYRALAKSERSTVNTGIITMHTDELIATMYLTYELLEDIVEGGNIDNNAFQSLVLDIMGEQIGLDLEEKLLLGDINSADPYLALQDGIIRLIQSNQVNQNNAPISHTMFAQMIKSLPIRFRNRLPRMKFYVNFNTEVDYRMQLAQRIGAYGDGILTGDAPISVLGVPMVKCGQMPSNTAILTDPMNILFGVQRRFRLATERSEENRLIKIIVTMRVGQTVEDEQMMVVGNNIGSLT
jgi:HK97 family phage major capsid protein